MKRVVKRIPREDVEAGRRLRDAGMAQALSGEDAEYTAYKEAYRAEFDRLARSGRPFFSDDIVREVGMPPAGRSNVIGALFNAALRSSLGRELEIVDWVQMRRPGAHARRTPQYARR